MEKHLPDYIYRNLANITSILGVLPLLLLFMEDGYHYLIPLIIFNNIMDDLDGQLAAKLNIRSRFGADLDNVCDAVAHVALALATGAHFGGLVLVASLLASASIIIRATSRLNPESVSPTGTPTNELMRQILFVLLLTEIFDAEPWFYLILVFILNSATMVAPFKLSFLLRGMASSTTAVIAINIALAVAWLIPAITPYIAFTFFTAYLYSFIVEGGEWLKELRNKR